MAGTRRLAAVMFTDLVGFTASAQANEPVALERLREQEGILRPLFAPFGGREIKSTGDGFLVEFESALQATECAVEIQRRLHERNARAPGSPIEVRIGIHVGDIEEIGGDIRGDAVNVASRVVPLAPPGGVCVSDLAFAYLRNKTAYPFLRLGPKTLKGVQDAMEVYRVHLPWDGQVSPTVDVSHPRLAVLPLASISPDAKDEYFADGLTEELISVLSKIRGLRVIARTSVGQYKSTTEPIPQIGQKLGVGSILEGSVRKAGNRIRISLDLIDVSTQEQKWSDTYDRQLDDVFAIQTEVAEQSAKALQVELLSSDREALERKSTPNLRAYEYYLRGIHALRAGGTTALRDRVSEGMRCFEAAIQIDPGLSPAYAYLANALVGGVEDLVPPRDGNLRAKGLADAALRLDPNSSDAHTARANVARWLDLDWAAAESEFQRAIGLNPSNSVAHFCYGMLLRSLQRFEEAKSELQSAIALQFDERRVELLSAVEFDPLDYGAVAWLTEVYCRLGEFDAAIALADQHLVPVTGDHRPHIALGWIYAAAGQWERARAELARSTGPASRWVRLCRATLLSLLGQRDDAAHLLKEWTEDSATTYVAPTWLAGLHAILGDEDRALSLLERDFREGDRLLSSVYGWEFFDSIRDNARFGTLLRTMNLPAELTGHRVSRAPAADPTNDPAGRARGR